MGWLLQTPGDVSSTLLGTILSHCQSAEKGGAAFAFASAQGIRMLAIEPKFIEFLDTASFTLVVGLDAITDLRAVDELKKLKEAHINFNPKLFVHSKSSSIFHPKTMWLKSPGGGAIITGSGNLTTGGLMTNWEAAFVDLVTPETIAEIEMSWDSWLSTNREAIREIDDQEAISKAEANIIVRTRVREVLRVATTQTPDEAASETIYEIEEEVAQEFALNPVLIAEVPKSGNRWQQVNFDLKSYQEYFGVTNNAEKQLRFYQVHDDGTLGAVENRQAVAVKSRNFRFEVGAAHGRPYPAHGHPIVIFLKESDNVFRYVLLMPNHAAHKNIQDHLNESFTRSNKKLRVQITAADLRRVWPDAPLFL